MSNYNSTEDIAVRNVFVHGTISRDSIKNKWQNQILIPRCRYLHFWRLHFFTFFEARPCPPKSHCQTNTARIVTTWQSCDKVSAWQACFQLLALAIVFHWQKQREIWKNTAWIHVTAWQAWQAWQRHCMTSMPSTLVSGVGVNISFRAATASPDTMLWGRLILIYNHIYKSRSIWLTIKCAKSINTSERELLG